ncbi:PEPxxWA-CTERM sorting domain-containing protein [Polymorphobacter multimanifer]|uniref:PEPxxWA-CTERM sorting domain-containing protein n=1 Tax=Polymorphobacter multimanifer TaxID=1070431 RepID=UPI001FB0E59A|nr:PEPxxWA-CTERM sorting domain-containing protein [Polymorphobacter multimanifer]
MRFVSTAGTSSFITTLSNSATSASGVPVVFSIAGAPPVLQGVQSLLTINATIPSASGGAGAFSLANMTGTFSIISNAAVTLGSITGTNLLSGTFGGASLNGEIGGGTGGVTASTVGGSTISFTSDFLAFSDIVASDLSWALSAVNNAFGNSAGRLRGFRATLGGQFSSEPAPRLLVPEPATWAMLVLGFGLVGVSVRRRRNVVVA